MDLLIFAGTLLVTGFYVKNKSKAVKRKHEEVVREEMANIPSSDPYYQKNENIYNSDKMAAVKEMEQKKADQMFTRTNLYAPMNTFDDLPFNEKPNVSTVKGLRTDKLSSSTFERFTGFDSNLTNKTEKVNDQPLIPQIPYEYADRLPYERDRWSYELGRVADGVGPAPKQFVDQPIIEGNYYPTPKSSEELYANSRTNNLANDRDGGAGGRAVVGQKVIAPTSVRPKRNYEVVDRIDNTSKFSVPAASSVNGTIFRALEAPRESKIEQTIDPKLFGPVSTNIRLGNAAENTQVEHFSTRDANRKLVEELDQQFYRPDGSLKGNRVMEVDNIPRMTERQQNIELDKYIGHSANPGLGDIMPKNKEDFRTTLKETLLHSRVAGGPESQNKEARDLTNYELKTTNKEINIESKYVGLAERNDAGEISRDIGDLRASLKETGLFDNPGRNLGATSFGYKAGNDNSKSDRRIGRNTLHVSEANKYVNMGGMETLKKNEETNAESRRVDERLNYDASKQRNIPSIDTNSKFTESNDVSMAKIKTKDVVLNF